MTVHYVEASSMRELRDAIESVENGLGKWYDQDRGINQISIQKDGDKFCAILSSTVLQVRGYVSTYIDGSGVTLPVNINPNDRKPYVVVSPY